MNHLELFHLAEEPFSPLPDTRFFFDGAGRAEALSQCESALAEDRRTVLVEAGAAMGKSMFAHKLAEHLAADGQKKMACVLVPSAKAHADKLLASLLRNLSGTSENSSASASDSLKKHIQALAQSGVRVVLAVDEAQLLSDSRVLGELLDLLTPQEGGEKLPLSMLFLALESQRFSSALQTALSLRGLKPAQVIRLNPLSHEEAHAYVAKRLTAAGLAEGAPSPFSAEAMQAVRELSAGAPGRINLLCEESMAEAARTKQKTVGANLVRQAADRLGLSPAGSQHWSPQPFSGADSQLPDNLEEIDAFLGSLQAE